MMLWLDDALAGANASKRTSGIAPKAGRAKKIRARNQKATRHI